jgi:hypothetical protein
LPRKGEQVEKIWAKIAREAPEILNNKMRDYEALQQHTHSRDNQLKDYMGAVLFHGKLGAGTPTLSPESTSGVLDRGDMPHELRGQQALQHSAKTVTDCCLQVMERFDDLTLGQKKAAQTIMNKCTEQLQGILGGRS